MKRYILFLISHFSFLICPVGAQEGMVTEIKILALNEFKELESLSGG